MCSTTSVSVWTIVVAAGGGTRFGAPKQFADLAGIAVLDRSVGTARAVSDGVVVVLPESHDWSAPDDVVTVTGGATRSASVRAGLERVPDSAQVVCVHDAARPLATADLYAAVIHAVRAGADAVVPALAVADTVKRVQGDRVVATVDRADLVVVQTPQGFAAAALRAAHGTAGEGTDDAALVEAAGGDVRTVPGEPHNLKITLADDLVVAAAWLERS
jgi:2-C-methyl-D-erythritol 4-phosphate cytidylyltransferase